MQLDLINQYKTNKKVLSATKFADAFARCKYGMEIIISSTRLILLHPCYAQMLSFYLVVVIDQPFDRCLLAESIPWRLRIFSTYYKTEHKENEAWSMKLRVFRLQYSICTFSILTRIIAQHKRTCKQCQAD